MKKNDNGIVSLNLDGHGRIVGNTLEEMIGFSLEAVMPVSVDDAINTIASHAKMPGYNTMSMVA